MTANATIADRETWLSTVESALATQPASTALALERARTLEALGRDEAEDAYRAVLASEPENFAALNDLARLLYGRMRGAEALELALRCAALHPGEAIAHANLGALLLAGNDAAGARASFERAIALDPENVEAHRGLALALATLGDEEGAREHRRIGFDARPFDALPYRGEGAAIEILLLVSATAGNTHFERMLDTRVFAVTKVIAESAHRIERLPAHTLVVNAVGDADSAQEALEAARRLVERSGSRVVNDPALVLETTRIGIAEGLRDVEGLRTPRTQLYSRDVLASAHCEAELAADEFSFPLLVRAPGHHTGRHFAYCDSVDSLRTEIATMPGDELLVIEFLDTARDGVFTKYRTIFVDGRGYPLHAAVSPLWKVHYFSADMALNEANREIDRRFLADPSSVVGAFAIRALERIAQVVELDYFGVDYAIDAQGRVVVFEANATMVVPKPANDSRWAYRIDATEAILHAFETMVKLRAKA